MTPPEKLKRVLKFTERIRQFKIESVRVHHSGWSEEKVMDEVRRCVAAEGIRQSFTIGGPPE